MATDTPKPAKSRNFSAAFERMVSFVAIAQTTDTNDTLKQLVLQCFIVLPDDRFAIASDLVNTIDVLFGLQVSPIDIERAIEELISENALRRSNGATLILDPTLRMELNARLEEANNLEDQIRKTWFEELAATFPQLPTDILWLALRNYLAKSFRRHGLQTIAYLDPSIDVSEEYATNLSNLLKEAVKQSFPSDDTHHADAARAVSNFMASVGRFPERVSYITQLADGAFNYYALTVDPQVAEQFRRNLQPLKLFLDTNFLFGILDLHVNQFVDVSNQIISSVQDHQLPFTFHYHVATDEEFRASIDFYGGKLRARTWKSSFSRVAATSRNLSGIELKYHQRNAESPLDVESFLRPYEHFDLLLKDKFNILTYRSSHNNNRLQERADLSSEYTEFLQRWKRDKSASLIDHDIKVLDAVREIRENATTSVEAGAILLTCDHTLYKFDWEMSRRNHTKAYVLLPNLFMQTLRPFVPNSADFDRSFAETFAIPEFRIIGSGVTKAASRLVSLLAAYQDLPEATAANLLSNDLLLDQLRTVNEDKEFQALVEGEIVNQNNTLLEEKAALELALEQQKQERERTNLSLAEAQSSLANEKAEKARALADAESERLSKEKTNQALNAEKQAREKAELEVQQAQKRIETYTDIFWISISVIIGVIVFILPNYFTISALNQNQHKDLVRFLVALSVGSFILGFSRKQWRSYLWGSLAVTVVLTLITYLL